MQVSFTRSPASLMGGRFSSIPAQAYDCGGSTRCGDPESAPEEEKPCLR